MPAEKADWRGSGFSTNKKTNNGHQIYQVRLLDWHQGPFSPVKLKCWFWLNQILFLNLSGRSI
jgi:hypothetical protein